MLLVIQLFFFHRQEYWLLKKEVSARVNPRINPGGVNPKIQTRVEVGNDTAHFNGAMLSSRFNY